MAELSIAGTPPVETPIEALSIAPVPESLVVAETGQHAESVADSIDPQFIERKQSEVLDRMRLRLEQQQRALVPPEQRGAATEITPRITPGTQQQQIEQLFQQARNIDEIEETEGDEIALFDRIGQDVSQIVGGVDDLALEAMRGINTLFKLKERYLGGADFQVPTTEPVPEAETVEGPAIRSLTEFFAAFFPALRATKATGLIGAGRVGQAVQGGVAGAVADLAILDPGDAGPTEMITNLIPALRNPLLDFLRADPNDTAALAKLKGATDGVITGVALDMFVQAARILKGSQAVGGIVRRFRVATRKAMKRSAIQETTTDAVRRELDELPDEVIDAAVQEESAASALRKTSALTETQGLLDAVQAGDQEVIDGLLKKRGALVAQDGSVGVRRGGRIDRYSTTQDAADDILNRRLTTQREKEFFDPERALKDALGLNPDKPWPRPGDAPAEAAEALETRQLKPPLVEVTDVGREQAQQFMSQEASGLADILQRTGKTTHVNFDRIQSGEDLRKVIAQTADIMREAAEVQRRGVQSIDDLLKQAESSRFQDVAEILGLQRGSALNAADALAVRQVWIDSANQLMVLAKDVAGGNVERATEFLNQFVIHSNIHTIATGVRAEAGRSLRVFGVDLAPGVRANMTALAEVIQNQNGISPQRLAAMIASLPSPEKLAQFTTRAQRATKTDMALEIWINALLSNPVTHTANFISNSVTTTWAIPERFLAAGMGDISLSEGVVMMRGMKEGMRDAFGVMWQSFKTGRPQMGASKIELARQLSITGEAFGVTGRLGKAVDYFGEFVRTPGRFLIASDEWFKAVNYRMELHAQAYRQAIGEGLTGDELGSRMAAIIENPPPGIKDAAENFAFYQTFTNSLDQEGAAFESLGKFSAKLAEGLDEAPVLRVALPFLRTPFNIARFTGERTPLGWASRNVRQQLLSRGPEAAIARSKMALGSMIMATVALSAAEGSITGRGPADPGLRAARIRTGWQPYSILIGDKYVSFQRLDPLGNLLGIVADLVDGIGEMDQVEAEGVVGAIFMAFYNNISSKTYMKGVAELMKTLSPQGYASDPERALKPGTRFFQQLAGSMVPSGLAQIARVNDPILRDARTSLDRILSRIPGLSKNVKPRRNLWGEAIQLEGGLGWDMASPLYIRTRKQDMVDDTIWDLRLPLHHAPRIWRTRDGEPVELSSDEYDAYVQLSAGIGLGEEGERVPLLKDIMRQVIQSDEWRDPNITVEGQRFILRALVSNYRDLAREQLLKVFPSLNARFRPDLVLLESESSSGGVIDLSISR